MKNWCFWTVVLEKTPESPLDCKEINQSILREIRLEYSLEGLMLKLNLQYFGHLIRRNVWWKRPWCWERMKAGGERDDRGRDGWMALTTQWTWAWESSQRWWRTEKPGMVQSMGSQRVTQLSDWTSYFLKAQCMMLQDYERVKWIQSIKSVNFRVTEDTTFINMI